MTLLLVLLFGLTIFLGTIITLVSNKKGVQELSLAMAFSVVILLVIFELIPESFEHLGYYSIIFIIIGMALIKVLDLFIPEHHHTSNSSHILHIGIITCIALVLHNLIEGMALYTTLENDLTTGLLTGFAISLHNIPMGMVIGTTLYDKNKSISKTLLISFLISLSTFVGGLLIFLFNNVFENMDFLLAITTGMLIYMALFELLHHLKHQNKKNTIIGLIIGVVVFLISITFHTH